MQDNALSYYPYTLIRDLTSFLSKFISYYNMKIPFVETAISVGFTLKYINIVVFQNLNSYMLEGQGTFCFFQIGNILFVSPI